MYSDLFDHLGGGRGAGGGGGGGPSSRGGGGASEPESAPPLLSFKAGKIIMEAKENVGPASNPPTYTCKADPRRGEIRLVWNENNTTGGGGGNNNNNNNNNSAGLYWQWYDRRQKTVVDRIPLSEHKGTTFERVELKDKQHEEDRIYVWTQKGGSGGNSNNNNDNKKYAMFWMQNADASKDDEIVTKVNEYLADPNSAAPAGSATAMDTSSDGTTTAAGGASGQQQSQVDALSSILENLGMPAAANAAASGGTTTAGGGTTSGSGSGGNGNAGGGTDADADGAAPPRPAGGTLTLADLQGAMVGIQQEQMQAASGVLPLEEVVTPDAVSGLLEDEAARARLMELLPPDQRNLEQLRDNLRCPQVQQTLRTLTLALLPDDAGNMDGFYSVLANFQLDPADGQAAMVGAAGAGGGGNGDPIRAFFDCILAAAEREKQREDKEKEKDAEEGKAGGEGEDKPKKEEGGGGGDDEGKEKEKDDEEEAKG